MHFVKGFIGIVYEGSTFNFLSSIENIQVPGVDDLDHSITSSSFPSCNNTNFESARISMHITKQWKLISWHTKRKNHPFIGLFYKLETCNHHYYGAPNIRTLCSHPVLNHIEAGISDLLYIIFVLSASHESYTFWATHRILRGTGT